MTSKEALENIRDFKPFGYDTTHKEEYALSGTLNDYLQEELSIIEKDLEDFEWLKSKLNLQFFDTLSNPEDKLRLLKIIGLEIRY